MLKKEIYLVLIAGISFWNLFSQNNIEFEKQLIKYHGAKDTLVGDNLWIYDNIYVKIKKVNLDIFKNSDIETYLVPMTWFLGYHTDEVNCLFTFDTKSKKINFVGELWCNGLKEDFFKVFIGYPMKNKNEVIKFVKDFEKLIQTNNPEVKFEHIYYDTTRTIFYQTDYSIPKERREVSSIIVFNYPKGKLISINRISPNHTGQVIN